MLKRSINHLLRSGLPWLLVGILGATLWLSTDLAGAAPALKPLFAPGDPPTMVNYQGIVNVGGAPHNGTGYFKFAIVDQSSGDGTTNYWANDGTANSEPAAEVPLSVTDGLFNVLLGDTSLTGMSQPLADTVFANSDTYLRVWFKSTSGGTFEALEPNQRLVSVPYALRAKYAESAGPQVAFSAYTQNHLALNGSQQTIPFDAEEFDDGNNFDTSTFTFVAPNDGVYAFQASCLLSTGSFPHRFYIDLARNGATVKESWSNIDETQSQPLHAVVKLNAGDTIQLRIREGSGGGSTLIADQTRTYFSGYQVY